MAKTGKSKPRKTSRDLRLDNQYMSWIEECRSAANEALDRRGEPDAEVALRAKVHPQTLRRFVSGKTMAPGADVVFHICNALEIPIGIPESYKKRHKLGGR